MRLTHLLAAVFTLAVVTTPVSVFAEEHHATGEHHEAKATEHHEVGEHQEAKATEHHEAGEHHEASHK